MRTGRSSASPRPSGRTAIPPPYRRQASALRFADVIALEIGLDPRHDAARHLLAIVRIFEPPRGLGMADEAGLDQHRRLMGVAQQVEAALVAGRIRAHAA